jgi:predicted DNA-binding protein with PD1-like motif
VKARELAAGTWALVFETGDEAFSLLSGWVAERGVTAARLTAIGAFERAVVGWFAWERRDYERIPVEEQVEVLSLVGDVALDPAGTPVVHAHALLGRRDGSTGGGHLLEGHVRPTLEAILDETPAHLRKRHDPESGLALIDPAE